VTEPALGWRLWHVHRGRLLSWAVDYLWEPGENVASCMVLSCTPCDTPPGRCCHCGFWALWTPAQVARRVGTATEPPWHVMGLVSGWGTVARHGREGFRAERAALRCLFTDRPWTGATPPGPPLAAAGWWRRRFEAPAPAEAAAPRGGRGRLDELAAVAARYGVPLVSLRSAVDLGLLSELGVPRAHVREAAGIAAAAAAQRTD
jgi:hypothetical protein